MRMLIVDDVAIVRRSLLRQMRRHPLARSWSCAAVDSPEAALSELRGWRFDILAADWHLSRGEDGTELAREVRRRESPIPILLYSALEWSVSDRAAALRAGADGVISLPLLCLDEFVAQVQALVRRASGTNRVGTVRVGDLEIDVATFSVAVGGTPVEMTRSQLQLLARLAMATPHVVSHDQLAQALGYPHAPKGSHLVQEAVRGLRGALGLESGIREARIESVAGLGYRLVSRSVGVPSGPSA